MTIRTWTFPSKSHPTDPPHITRLHASGLLDCSCRGWTMAPPDTPRCCTHLRDHVIPAQGFRTRMDGQLVFVVGESFAALNGLPVALLKTDTTLVAWSTGARLVLVTDIPAHVRDAARLLPDCVLTGLVADGVFHADDVAEVLGVDVTNHPCDARLAMLELLVGHIDVCMDTAPAIIGGPFASVAHA